jgi:prepilin-type N-terminal cleavage/methylation domain-containing protein
VTVQRGFSLFELLASCAIVAILASLLVIPSYVKYAQARQIDDASAILAQDIGYLERFAQDSDPLEGATIEVQSDDPLRYTCYSGRPSLMDPQSRIRDVLIVRDFPDVRIVPGALSHASPLLFARNGSIQYVADGQWNDQHQTFSIELQSKVEAGRTSYLTVDPFTGGVSQ